MKIKRFGGAQIGPESQLVKNFKGKEVSSLTMVVILDRINWEVPERFHGCYPT